MSKLDIDFNTITEAIITFENNVLNLIIGDINVQHPEMHCNVEITITDRKIFITGLRRESFRFYKPIYAGKDIEAFNQLVDQLHLDPSEIEDCVKYNWFKLKNFADKKIPAKNVSKLRKYWLPKTYISTNYNIIKY